MPIRGTSLPARNIKRCPEISLNFLKNYEEVSTTILAYPRNILYVKFEISQKYLRKDIPEKISQKRYPRNIPEKIS